MITLFYNKCVVISFITIHFIFQAGALAQRFEKINLEMGMNETASLNLSDISDELYYVILETTSDIIISDIDIIKKSGNMFFISSLPPLLSVFDKTGKFVHNIGKQGRGPNEYTYLSAFTINDSEKQIYVYSKMPDKILVYKSDGEYLKQIKFPDFQPVSNIEFISENCFVIMKGNFQGNTPYSYSIYNRDFRLIMNAIKPFQYKTNGAFTMKHEFSYYHFGNKFFIKENFFNDTLYLFSEKSGFIPYYTFYYGRFKPPVKLKTDFKLMVDRNDLKYIIMRNIFETHKYLLYSYIYNKLDYYGFYDKASKKAHSFQRNAIKNDIDSGPGFKPLYQKNNELIGFIHAYELIAHVASSAFKNSTPKYPDKKRELECLANSLSENDNPVLMIVKLKE